MGEAGVCTPGRLSRGFYTSRTARIVRPERSLAKGRLVPSAASGIIGKGRGSLRQPQGLPGQAARHGMHRMARTTWHARCNWATARVAARHGTHDMARTTLHARHGTHDKVTTIKYAQNRHPLRSCLRSVGALSGLYRGTVCARGTVGALSGLYRGTVGALSEHCRGTVGALSGHCRGGVYPRPLPRPRPPPPPPPARINALFNTELQLVHAYY